MSLYISTVSDAQLEETISQNTLPVFVEFTATWCGPAKAAAPFLDKLATQYRDQITFLSIDVENFPLSSKKYLTQAVPTYLMFKKGQRVGTVTGPNQPEISLLLQKTLVD